MSETVTKVSEIGKPPIAPPSILGGQSQPPDNSNRATPMLSRRSNVFLVTVEGKGVEPQKFRMKAHTADVAKTHGNMIANAQRRRAMQNGGDDPELKVTKVETIGDDQSPPGAFRPPGAKPINLNKFVRNAPERVASE